MITQLFLKLDGGMLQSEANSLARVIEKRAGDLLTSRKRIKKRLSISASPNGITLKISTDDAFNWYPLVREFGMQVDAANAYNIHDFQFNLLFRKTLIPFLMRTLKANEWGFNCVCRNEFDVYGNPITNKMSFYYKGRRARIVLLLGLSAHIIVPDGETITTVLEKINTK